MSAAEIIEQARRLGREDRERLIESLLELDSTEQVSVPAESKVDWSGTIERAKRIVGDRVLPNMVLEERESYKY
jgi:hypothetical protein